MVEKVRINSSGAWAKQDQMPPVAFGSGDPNPEAQQSHGGDTGCKVVGLLKLSNVNTWRHSKTQDGINLEQPDLASMLDLLQAKGWTLHSSLPTAVFP